MGSPALTRNRWMLIVILSFVSLLLLSCTVVSDKDKQKTDTNSFNPDAYVAKIWTNKVLPYFKEKCVSIREVLPIYVKDQAAAGKRFGYRQEAEGNPWNFLVKGSGRIVSVNTASLASTIGVNLVSRNGTADVLIQIGPVIKGSSIRDTLPFVSFTDFENQIQFARISNAFNKKVNETVTGKLDRKHLMGKSILFYGAFTQLQDSDLIRITPVSLKIE